MEQKEKYTFEELCSKLEISMSAFSREARVDEGTIARIRKGHLARRSTVNKLLRVFSEIYKIEFSLDNVTGISLQGATESPTAVTEQEPVQPVSTRPYDDSSRKQEPQILNAEPSEGDVLLNDFAKISGIPIRTLCNWKDASPPKIEVISHKRDGGGGFEYFISPEQQEKALELRKRYPGKRK